MPLIVLIVYLFAVFLVRVIDRGFCGWWYGNSFCAGFIPFLGGVFAVCGSWQPLDVATITLSNADYARSFSFRSLLVPMQLTLWSFPPNFAKTALSFPSTSSHVPYPQVKTKI